ncbi:MAG: hypothetical protein IME93_04955 [Proteobacteria bacterium]|nr:hypothetical protein [Pseudomonadota bacterium]
MSMKKGCVQWPLMSCLIGLLLSINVLAAQDRLKIPVKELESVNNAMAVMRIASISSVLNGLNQGNEVRLKIIYGDDDAAIWAGRLEQWLVSLGVESRRIRKQTGVLAPGELMLELIGN